MHTKTKLTFQTTMLYSTYTASRDPKYVDDPTSFKPERWSKDSTEDLDAFVSLPFGFGPRSCYGDVYHGSVNYDMLLVTLFF